MKINLISQKWKFNNDELIKGLRKLWESHILNPFHTYFPNLLPISLQIHLYTFLFLYLLHFFSYLFSSSHPWVFTIYRLAGTHLPLLFSDPIFLYIRYFVPYYQLPACSPYSVSTYHQYSTSHFSFLLILSCSHCSLLFTFCSNMFSVLCSLFPVPSGSFADIPNEWQGFRPSKSTRRCSIQLSRELERPKQTSVLCFEKIEFYCSLIWL